VSRRQSEEHERRQGVPDPEEASHRRQEVGSGIGECEAPDPAASRGALMLEFRPGHSTGPGTNCEACMSSEAHGGTRRTGREGYPSAIGANGVP
jgi:hypothetical protein